MYSHRLPSTSALRVFECAARHGSCTAAADELCLSQSAVSKHLKGLESSLGVALFQRAAHGLCLTAAGQSYLATAHTVLEQLEAAQARLGTSAWGATLRIRLLPSLGERWLLPRLGALGHELPQVRLQFSVGAGETAHGEFVFGAGPWPGQEAGYLFGRDVVLVVAAAQAQGWDSAAHVFRHGLIEHAQVPQHWPEFLAAHGLSDPGRSVRRSSWGYYALVIRAVLAGEGAALVPRALVAGELSRGELANPLRLGVASRAGYHFVHGRPPGLSVPLAALRQWLVRQARD